MSFLWKEVFDMYGVKRGICERSLKIEKDCNFFNSYEKYRFNKFNYPSQQVKIGKINYLSLHTYPILILKRYPIDKKIYKIKFYL